MADFEGLVPDDRAVERAFDLSVAEVAAGRCLALQFDTLPAGVNLVLARVLSRSGLYGLEPVERFRTGADGALISLEPVMGERLPGVTGAGEYVLLRLPAAQGLVHGTVRDGPGQPAAGWPVRLNGQPWLTFSAPDGGFRLIAPAGTATLSVTELATGNTGGAEVVLADAGSTAVGDVGVVPSGPRVVSVTPADGATGVARVASVVVEFSKPIHPAALAADGIRLLDANGQPVAASVTLNLRNSAATLLPTARLAASTLHRIVLSANIVDAGGLRLEGPTEFTFKTESDALNRDPKAQLISYEPVDGVSGVVGTPGLAEPEAEVIIVNETTGRSATTLSKTDGSFTNSIEAQVDDFITAVLVNRNGTRGTVSLSRQIYPDGSVGLFGSGGTVEAETPEGPLQLVIEPGAIGGKSKFKLDYLTLPEVQAVASNTPPEFGARIVGGFKVAMEGQRLKYGPHVSFPIKESDLCLSPGDSPGNHVYSMCEPVAVDDVMASQG